MVEDKILVVDDDPAVCELLSTMFDRLGFNVTLASDGAFALEMIKKDGFSVAIVDLNMPGLSGNKTIQLMKQDDPDIEIIIFTGNPTIESSIDAIHSQVADYICKPSDMTTIERSVRRAIERRQLILENEKLMRELELERNSLKKEIIAAKRGIAHRLEESPLFVGESNAIQQIRYFIAQVAPTDMTVFIRGESGAGKEVVARLIHETSGRDLKTFVKINCPAIPESLLESELFGHEAGAFTGAGRQKPGRFELASGGTIFLDEIGDLPLMLQGKLLQVIEHKRFARLGGKKTIEVDVRIIAATNAPIDKMIANGCFRTDVFYRLNEYAIEIPPLRERIDDIPLLVQHFINLFGKKYGRTDMKISSRMMSHLIAHTWPGNVRELKYIIHRVVLDGNENTILESMKACGAKRCSPETVNESCDAEIEAIRKALAETNWNRKKAARHLEMSYHALRRRIDKYGLKVR
jgi:DNA-binding NtrC family response regulator